MAWKRGKQAHSPMTQKEADARIREIQRVYAEFESKIEKIKKERNDLIESIALRLDKEKAEKVLATIQKNNQ